MRFLLYMYVWSACRAIHLREWTRGVYRTTVVFGEMEMESSRYRMTHIKGNSVYVVQVMGGVVDTVVCRETVTTPIIVAPRGCDNREESVSVLRTNCGHKTVEGLYENWWRSPTDDACLLGGPGVTCLGPVYLYETDRPYDPEKEEVWSMVKGVYLRSGTGPGCAMPVVTRVDIDLPRLNVTSGNATGVYDVDVQGTAYTFSDGTVYKPGGNATLTAVPLRMREEKLAVPSDYFKNKVGIYGRSMVCHFGVSRKRFENNRPLWRGIPEGVPYGGQIVARTSHGVPVEIAADAQYADFDGDCARFYPASAVFRGFGFSGVDGPEYSRTEVARHSCFAPFPFPERIVEIGTLEERAKQCHLLGGVLATRTSDICAMDSWRTYCRRGWLYFDSRCWYTPDETRDGLYQVPSGADAENVCQRLHVSAIATMPVALATSAWLQRFFVHRRPGTTVRVLIEGGRCECYSSTGVTACDCETPTFPLCSYSLKSDVIPWTSMDMHPRTLEMLQRGQKGQPHDGTAFTCECEPGWTGPLCTQETCVPPVLAALTVNESLANPQLVFFKRCYANQRGFCQDGDVYHCQCAPGFGPPAEMQGMYTDTPCTCPAWTVQASVPREIQIGSVVSVNQVGVCGFATHGRCLPSGWNEARCECTRAFEGRSCACRRARYLPGSSTAVESICSGHGTCCPHGERDDGTVGHCPPRTDGCRCDDGWGGESCTSSVPRSSPIERPSMGGYTRQRIRLPVGYVYTRTGSWVRLADTLYGSPFHDCTEQVPEEWEDGTDRKFLCDHRRAWYIVAEGPVVKVTESTWGICGLHVNPRAARYFEDPPRQGAYRPVRYTFQDGVYTVTNVTGPLRVYMTTPWARVYPLDPAFCVPLGETMECTTTEVEMRLVGEVHNIQEYTREPAVETPALEFRFARYGSTPGPCLCDAGYVGPTCSVAVSAWRLDESTARWTYEQCGGTTEPRRGQVVEDHCECNAVGSELVFTGAACECALVNGVPCAGHGTCVPARFPMGRCDGGWVPEPPPLLGVSQFRVWNTSTVALMNGSEWTLERGRFFLLKGVFVSISTRENSTMPVTMLTAEGEVPIMLTSVFATLVQTSGRHSAWGVVDCGDWLFRLVDDALGLGFCPPSRHALGYGIFQDATLDFKNKWDHRHYVYVHSLIPRRCDEFGPGHWTSILSNLTGYIKEERVSNVTVLPPATRQFLLMEPVYDLVAMDRHGMPCVQIPGLVPRGTLIECPCPGGCQGTSVQAKAWYGLDALDDLRVLLQVGFPAPATCTGAALHLGNETDEAYLRRFFDVKLSTPGCADDQACEHLDARCVPEESIRQSWFSGPGAATRGVEGGCECTEMYDPLTFCASCLPGYGGDTCTVPIDPTSARTGACNHRGRLLETYRVVNETRWVTSGTIKRCVNLLVQGYIYTVLETDTVHPDIQSFYNGTRWIHMVQGRVFAEEWECIPFGGLERVRRVGKKVYMRDVFTVWI